MSNSQPIDHGKILSDLMLELVDIRDIHPTGSSYTCEPPVLNTDVDFICQVDSLQEFVPVAQDLKWVLGGADYGAYMGPFKAFRSDNINLIVTDHPLFYQQYVTATELAKRFNLLDKKDRIDLFQAIVDKHDYSPKRDERSVVNVFNEAINRPVVSRPAPEELVSSPSREVRGGMAFDIESDLAVAALRTGPAPQREAVDSAYDRLRDSYERLVTNNRTTVARNISAPTADMPPEVTTSPFGTSPSWVRATPSALADYLTSSSAGIAVPTSSTSVDTSTDSDVQW